MTRTKTGRLEPETSCLGPGANRVDRESGLADYLPDSSGPVMDSKKTCMYCGATYELPPDYVSGKNRAFQTVHPRDRATRLPSGQVIIIVAGEKVHECWWALPP